VHLAVGAPVCLLSSKSPTTRTTTIFSASRILGGSGRRARDLGHESRLLFVLSKPMMCCDVGDGACRSKMLIVVANSFGMCVKG